MIKVSPIIYTGLQPRHQVMITTGRSITDPERIIEAVCENLFIQRDVLMSKSRKKELSEARAIAIGLILQVNRNIRLQALGTMFGGRDHSTIIYNRDTFNNLYKRDKPFTAKVEEVLKYV